MPLFVCCPSVMFGHKAIGKMERGMNGLNLFWVQLPATVNHRDQSPATRGNYLTSSLRGGLAADQ